MPEKIKGKAKAGAKLDSLQKRVLNKSSETKNALTNQIAPANPTSSANQLQRASPVIAGSANSSANSANFQNASHVFLDPNPPKLSLPTFLGSFDTWLWFKDIFDSIIHKNVQVPNIFKFHYLKSCVMDEAAEVIASIESSSDNYKVGWRLTVQWIAGNLACKVFLFLRAFGLYLSSNILICVSLDRYFAVLHPLKLSDARRRGKLMLSVAWILSIICASPQSFIFHVASPPIYPNFTQCVTFGFFKSSVDENAYNIFCVLAMYFIPLVIICWVYTKILCEITNKSRESKQAFTRTYSTGTPGSFNSDSENRMRLRCSNMSRIERARIRTLRMTITIVAVFILCWTPYVTMMLWYIVDRQSAQQVDQEYQEALFIMAVGNSCANPLVYGSYAVDLKKECCRCFFPCSKKTTNDMNYIPRITVYSEPQEQVNKHDDKLTSSSSGAPMPTEAERTNLLISCDQILNTVPYDTRTYIAILLERC
ncbi:gonadotropin-releasing hormone II receptor-like [Belonocnema kinseyi]|uniref:gonadotropin-releasing hormone II receptor-like n=1 Tax=Belonocnema kinseyi TaxID=2817044 RepID=UPI00143D1CFF|nr:gonadotropin-releasing hormone II receptor-like [Belonocnema kinseyi]